MKKRLAVWLILSLMCGIGTARAEKTTRNLPRCYQYVIVGAAHVYSDWPVDVHATADPAGTVVGSLRAGQSIHVEEIDEMREMAYVYYYENNNALPTWASQDAQKGWIPTEYVFNMVGLEDLSEAMVVITQTPGDRLNLRTKPSASSNSKGKYYAGTVVRKLDNGANGFFRVQIGHTTGYMQAKYLSAGLYTPSAELPSATVISEEGAGLQMHKQPKQRSEAIKDVPEGAVVTVLGIRADGWYMVCFENEIGYAPSKSLSPKLRYKIRR